MPSFITAEQVDLPLEVSMENACLMTPDDADFLLQTMIAIHNDLEDDITYASGQLERMEVYVPTPDDGRALEDLANRRKLTVTWGSYLNWRYYFKITGTCNGCGSGRDLTAEHDTTHAIYGQAICAALLDRPRDCFKDVENCSLSIPNDAP
jgi:hypothetical protein